MGDDTIYSGTVAAAAEGYLLGIPSIASIGYANRSASASTPAARVVAELMATIQEPGPPPTMLLNVNVPDHHVGHRQPGRDPAGQAPQGRVGG